MAGRDTHETTLEILCQRCRRAGVAVGVGGAGGALGAGGAALHLPFAYVVFVVAGVALLPAYLTGAMFLSNLLHRKLPPRFHPGCRPVSVIVCARNEEKGIYGTIGSIAQQEYDGRVTILCVDNGSTDESLAIARSYVGRANYTLIENAENTGFSYAVNQGIRAAKGEFVALFNNDAFAEPDWLANLLAAAEQDERIFAVSSLMIRHFERELADDAGDYVTILGFACKRGDGMKVSRYQKPGRVFSACGGAALYRKSILDKIGLFDEHFFAYFEDVDISWRANSLGYKNVYCPTARCYHICGATTGAVRYNPFKSVQSGRNSILLPLKNEPLLMLILNFIPLAVGYLLKCYKFHKQGFGEAWDKGMHEAFALLKSGRLGKRPFRLKDLPNYILMELWMIWNMVPYLWYRLVIVKFDLK